MKKEADGVTKYQIRRENQLRDREHIARKRVLTTGEAAAILMMSRSSVKSMISKGVLKGHRSGPTDQKAHWKILQPDLLEYMRSCGQESLIPKSWLAETPEAILTRLVAWSESSTAHPTDVYAIVDSAKAWLEQTGCAK
jgi:excisionase family DNA binding protein